jgi:hypothetical protein
MEEIKRPYTCSPDGVLERFFHVGNSNAPFIPKVCIEIDAFPEI